MNDDTTPEPPPEAPPVEEHPALNCGHGKIVSLPYGLRKCVLCGSTEGTDKVWRHPDVIFRAWAQP